ncbi:Permease [Sphingomonas antarctica]|uniref:AI-2E family transporter n=1 Tax=Sphingomonas antarctica TaxID=2040274 RepID=UPI0039E9D570
MAEAPRQDASTRPTEAPGPNEMRDPVVREELKRAGVWIALIVAVVAAYFLSQPLLLIFGGVVLATMLDGGVRLLGRRLKIARGWRLGIVVVGVVAFLVWTMIYAGSQIASQAEGLRVIVTAQVQHLLTLAHANGLIGADSANEVGKQVFGSLGRVTSFVGSALGALTSAVMMLVIGVFLAIEPGSYERGLAWMFPVARRASLYDTLGHMGYSLRRLMLGRLIGMAVEGVSTWLLLWAGGVPMAALLGLLTGLLAFLPNIGSIISGTLIVLVGLSAGGNLWLYAFAVYLGVQLLDGWLIVPTVARKSVDLAPALVLAAQLLFGAAFGFLGLLFADPLLAMVKVALEARSGLDPKAEGKRAEL